MEKIRFSSQEHQDFYFEMLNKRWKPDSYTKSFFYVMGLTEDTRSHINSLFDFKEDAIKPEGKDAACMTSGSRRVCNLAFNLWCGHVDEESSRASTPDELFYRRLIIVRFDHTVPDSKKDGDLKEKLMLEKEGIIAWAMVGLVTSGFYQRSCYD